MELHCRRLVNGRAVTCPEATPNQQACGRYPHIWRTFAASQYRMPARRTEGQVVWAAKSTAVSKKRVTERRGRAPEDDDDDDDLLWPLPQDFQQTLRGSFTMKGLGLHSAQPATVRVRPAHAREGRYFVKLDVDPTEEPQEDSPVERGGEETSNSGREGAEGSEQEGEEGAANVERFLHYLREQDAGYEASYQTFLAEVYDWHPAAPPGPVPLEKIVPFADGEGVMRATLDHVVDAGLSVTLDCGSMRVVGAEHLLAALEGCGIDNARIEVWGEEVPILDGSAAAWTIAIQGAGFRAAPPAPGQPGVADPETPQMVLAPREVVTVRDGDAFIAFFPESTARMTYGLDHSTEAPIIGKQWLNWAPGEGLGFRWTLAPAKTYYSSLEECYRLRKAGFIKAGTVGSAVIAYGERWYEPAEVHFFDDEPVRHKLLDLLGDMSLLAQDGSRGLPLGHIVAYKAGHDLHMRFARTLRSTMSPDSQMPVSEVP